MIVYRGIRFSGYNKPKRTPGHKTKSHVVLAKSGDKIKLIRFGQQGAKKQIAQRLKEEPLKQDIVRIFAKGRMSATYWANLVKWNPRKTKNKRK